MQKNATAVDIEESDNFVIPDLCQINNVLFTLILTQLLALFITLISTSDRLLNWENLGLLSIFCHSVALSFALAICLTRKVLFKKSSRIITIYFMSVNILITTTLSWGGVNALLPGHFEAIELFALKSTIISACLAAIILRYFFLRQSWRRQKQAELNARIQALQARIRPHFLFNSMNSIASLIMIDPDRAENAVLDLSSLFRATLNNQQTKIPLDEEITLCRQYLNIEGLRLGDRLQVEWQLEPIPVKVEIPPLILQPLFENAIYHGIQPLTNGGLIKAQTQLSNGFLYILISNPFEQQVSNHKGNHIALENIQSRLQAIYGDEAILKTSHLDKVFTVTIRIPVMR